MTNKTRRNELGEDILRIAIGMSVRSTDATQCIYHELGGKL